MKRSFFILMVALIVFCTLFVSCNANVEAPADELVTISFDNDSARALSSNLETFTPGAYYWKYAAKKADTSNLISGQTANYDSDPESGALWIKEGEPGFGVTSGELYTPFKVQGFSQGLWNFRLFGYKKVIGDNPATSAVETEYYLLAYSGETTGVLLKQNGTNLVKAIVSPTQTGNGTLVVKITGTDKITLDPATPGLIPNTKIKLKVEKITSTATTTVFDDFVTEDYNESLEAGTYKVTVKFTNDDASVEFASGSVVSTVYANLTTTVKGNLTEVITSAIFGAEQNPDIITTSIGTASITQGTTASSVNFTSTTATKVTASMPTAAAKSLITAMEEELDAKTSSSTSQTSDLTLNLSVNTTEATETTVTYEIGMEATLIYEKKDAQASQKTTTKSTVETLDDFVTVVIDLRANLQDVSVTHSGTVMTECASLDILSGKTKAQDTTGIGFYFYDSASGKLYIKTWKFSPFQLSYTVPSYVAAIGSVRYTSLKAALDSVVEGDTVTLLSNINLEISKEDAVNVDGRYAAFLVKPFKNLTIDGNGKIITINTSDSDVKDVFSLDANGGTGGANIDNVWNIKNISINATGFQTVILSNAEINKSHVANLDNVEVVTDGESIYANGEVTINVNGSTLTHSGEYASGMDPVYYSAVIVGYSGRINLSECTINSFGNAVATFPSGGSITLTDCNVSTTAVEGEPISGNIIWSRNEDYSYYPEYTENSIITVNSGNYDGAIYVSQAWESSKSSHLYAKVNINGGVFSHFAVTESHASECDLVAEGHVVITAGTYDSNPSIYVADGFKAVKDGTVWHVVPVTEDDQIYVTGTGFSSYMTFAEFRDSVNSGDDYEDCTVTLLHDVDLAGKSWTPIGMYSEGKPFKGTFLGGGHTIKNLTADFSVLGDGQGLFGYTQDATISNLTIKNFDLTAGDDAGILVGTIKGNTNISNISIIDSKIVGGDPVGGLVGICRETDTSKKTIIKDCSIDVDTVVKSSSDRMRAGGFVGGIKSGSVMVFEGCSFNGKCYGEAVASFIAHDLGNVKINYQTFINCSAPAASTNLFNSDGTGAPVYGGVLVGRVDYGPAYVVDNLVVGGNQVSNLTFEGADATVGVYGLDGTTGIIYMVKAGEAVKSGDVSFVREGGNLVPATPKPVIHGDFTFSLDQDYALTIIVPANSEIVLRSGGLTPIFENAVIVGSTGSTLRATCIDAGNNKSFEVSGTKANFYDPDGGELTVIKSGYWDIDGTTPVEGGIVDLIFDWDSQLKGWKLRAEYAYRYKQFDVSISGPGYTGPEKMTLTDFRDSVNDGTTYAGCTVTLLRNVDLKGTDENQWVPIGLKATGKVFSGIFDGNNKTVSGLWINSKNGDNECYAFFGMIDNATIKDLTVIGTIVANDSAGGVVGRVRGASLISNVTNRVDVSAYDKVGGIASNIYPGYPATYTDCTARIENCKNYGTIICLGQRFNASLISGGIVGQVSNFGSVEFVSCTNYGVVKTIAKNLTSQNLSTPSAGFIIGQTSNSGNSGDSDEFKTTRGVYLNGCINNSESNNLINLAEDGVTINSQAKNVAIALTAGVTNYKVYGMNGSTYSDLTAVASGAIYYDNGYHK